MAQQLEALVLAEGQSSTASIYMVSHNDLKHLSRSPTPCSNLCRHQVHMLHIHKLRQIHRNKIQ